MSFLNIENLGFDDLIDDGVVSAFTDPFLRGGVDRGLLLRLACVGVPGDATWARGVASFGGDGVGVLRGEEMVYSGVCGSVLRRKPLPLNADRLGLWGSFFGEAA